MFGVLGFLYDQALCGYESSKPLNSKRNSKYGIMVRLRHLRYAAADCTENQVVEYLWLDPLRVVETNHSTLTHRVSFGS